MPSTAGFAAMSLPVMYVLQGTWTIVPERSRVGVALQMSWRRGGGVNRLGVRWRKCLPGCQGFGLGRERHVTWWSAQLAMHSSASGTEICHRGKM